MGTKGDQVIKSLEDLFERAIGNFYLTPYRSTIKMLLLLYIIVQVKRSLK